MPAKKQITRDMILDAALKLLKERGADAVNIKALAAELHCSTQPVYLSFTGMDELRAALVPLAMDEFTRIMRSDSPDGAVCLYGMEYIHLAKEEPNLFRFLFMRSNAFEEIRRRLSPIIEQSISELMAAYHISHEEADFLHDHLWMHTHGIAAMIATQFCDWNMDKVQTMLEQCRAAFTAKYEAAQR